MALFKYVLKYFLLITLCSIIPHPKIRSIYLRLLGATIGDNVRIENVKFIQIQHSIKNLTCLDDSFVGTDVIIDLSEKLVLGKKSIISPRCTLLTHQDFGDFNGNLMKDIYKTKYQQVTIGDNVVIGTDVTVLAGSIINSSSVIGAKSLVVGEIPEGVLALGIPAKVVKNHLNLREYFLEL